MVVNRTTQNFLISLFYLVRDLAKQNPKSLIVVAAILLVGFLIPQNMVNPVQGATTADWNEDSFWFYTWGKSVTHKGIDIFAKEGTPLLASTHGLVVYTGNNPVGGNFVVILGPKWRFHYYAHLKEIKAYKFKPVKRGSVVGSVGNTGNAVGKPHHLHYSITSPFPYFWRYDNLSKQGWKKMFYLNPDAYLRD